MSCVSLPGAPEHADVLSAENGLMPSKPGETALVLFVPEAEPVVQRWRRLHDPAAGEGMPAHITVLYPFAPAGAISEATRESLARFCRDQAPIRATFARLERFPGVLWLDPSSTELICFFQAVHAEWPDFVPYARPDYDVTPHLTVVQGIDPALMDRITDDLRPHLPFEAVMRAMSLVAFDGAAWVRGDEFPFAL
jgi:2'-5' RNA ligase